ncbi:hypothetical protein RV11_GL003168 [Enterococcus phoeniculicola]|uniref:Uncharacterized protein n=1 Tax=Enterococcus phoeniculicola ATCC BAA-412 TaxID=1158610 RepID=R3WMG0_9ENTE|nr:hypothetical protein [Enterococcus phoeniculicola]EOL43015.1 hypothetical protein UC3_01992 [Enterococcus phoeniculicola ATCC BAA-412]EOT76627.1 hypothetical protein I589_01584 [Enterococcus phoeniculicola ATCC BAA-412]OJG72197.1 hypothetical protein RV11_GL003168 [Enterococcus phoeniculicola]
MPTRTELNSAKRRVKLLLSAQEDSYESWLYEKHCQFIEEKDTVILEALAQYVKQKGMASK